MKILIGFLLLSFISISSISQGNFTKISMKENKDQILNDTILVSVLKQTNINISDYTVITLKGISDSFLTYENKNINFDFNNIKIYYKGYNNFKLEQSLTKVNKESPNTEKKKYLFCYRGGEKNVNGNYKVQIYTTN